MNRFGAAVKQAVASGICDRQMEERIWQFEPRSVLQIGEHEFSIFASSISSLPVLDILRKEILAFRTMFRSHPAQPFRKTKRQSPDHD